MNDFTPSKSQLAAIDTEGCSLLVSAAAGSGKTAVLTQRAMRMICDEEAGIWADSLLIVTFTNAAAAELKTRLQKELALRTAQQPGNKFLKKQKLLLARAPIGTLDAFCKNLCLEHFTQLSLSPDFKLAQQHILEKLCTQAMDSTLDEMLSQADFAEFADIFPKARSIERVREAITLVHRAMIAYPHPLEYTKNIKALAAPHPLTDTAVGDFIFAYTEDSLQNAAAFLRKAVDIAVDMTQNVVASEILENELQLVCTVLKAAEEHDYNGCRALLVRTSFETLRFEKGCDESDKTLIKTLRDGAKEIVKTLAQNLFFLSEQQLEEDNLRHFRYIFSLCCAADYYYKTLQLAKQEAQSYDFYDMQHLVVDLLEQPDTGRTIAARYSAIMVDEYQDTNPLFDYIYHLLANEKRTNIFMVGDVKQSIYGFNSARPDIFVNKSDSYAQSDDGQVIYLAQNYRSAPALIGTVNDLFGLIMSRPVGGVDYDKNNMLFPYKEHTPDTGVTLNVAEGTNDFEYVARLCADLIKQGYAPEDICILLRSKKYMSDYAATLARYGVNADITGENEMFSDPGVMPLVSLLTLLSNPFDEVQLAAVLLSPLVCLGTDELCEIYAAGTGNLMLRVRLCENPKAVLFCSRFEELRRAAAGLSTVRLISQIYEVFNAYVICGAISPTARTGMSELEELSKSYDEMGQYGLFGFVRQLEQGANTGVKPTVKGRAGCVGIMTIHRSKGLEFSVCILADTSHRFNLEALNAPVLHHYKTGVGSRLCNKDGVPLETLFRRSTAIALRGELQSEELRILYVAATRAKEQLHMFVMAENLENKLSRLAAELYGAGGVSTFLAQKCSCFGDFLLYFGLMHPKGEPLRRLVGAATVPLLTPHGELSVTLNLQPCETAEASDNIISEPLKEDVSGLSEAFKFVYPYISDTQTPIKTTVSAMVHGDEWQKTTPKRPQFVKGEYTRAEKGTAIHAFLQYCDFSAAIQDIDSEFVRLCENRFLSQDNITAISLPQLRRFFESDIAKRIAVAKKAYREYEFIIQKNDIYIQGIVDLVIVEDDKLVLVDYKTDKNKSDNEFLSIYSPQLLLYKEALQKRFLMPVKQTIIYSIENLREIVVEV